MWNPFKRQDGASEASGNPLRDEHADGPDNPALQLSERQDPLDLRNTIATLQHIGSAAVATLTVTELTQDQGVERLTELLDDLQASGAKHFVLDIQNVQYMDSACLGCLVEALNRMTAIGGKIALANTANRVQYLFRLTRLDRVFPICQDVMSAIEAIERAA
jgi:anti-anti-sigma factor